MAKQVINVGASPNDGSGDFIRFAMQKTNANFSELYDSVAGAQSTADSKAAINDVLADNDPTAGVFTRSASKIGTLIAAAVTALGLGSISTHNINEFPVTIPDRTTLSGYSATNTAYFDGSFWDRSTLNWATEVTLDPQQGVYVALPGGGSPGAAGAWKRRDAVITPYHFQAIGDLVADDAAPLQAYLNFAYSKVRPQFFDGSGSFATTQKIYYGPAAVVSDNYQAHFRVGGDMSIYAIAPLDEIVECQYLKCCNVMGRLSVKGQGSAAWSTRTCGVGIKFTTCSQANFVGGVRASTVYYLGVVFGSDATHFNDNLSISRLEAIYCGSSITASSLAQTANWSAPVNNGTSGGFTQSTTLSVDALPPVLLDNYQAWGSKQAAVVINGEPYAIDSIDRVNSTITIYRWLDSAVLALGSGTLTYIYGGSYGTYGGDSGIINIGHVYAIDCGIGLGEGALYGSRIGSAIIESCGIAIGIGSEGSAAHIGTSADAIYVEGNTFDVIGFCATGGNDYSYITSTYNVDITKCWSLQDPRQTSGDKYGGDGGGFGSSGGNGQSALTLAVGGRLHAWHQRPLGNPDNSGTISFYGHTRPPAIVARNANAYTAINLINTTKGAWNRCFGYRGNQWIFVGTGTNGAPTGAFPFNPPTMALTGCTIGGDGVTVTVPISGPATRALATGMPVSGTGVAGGATVSAIGSRTQFTLSAASTPGSNLTLTFTGSVNGVFAAASFSGFDGPALFDIQHTDVYEMIWTVRCLSGQTRLGLTAMGYAAGAGIGSGTAQLTSRSTAITMNKLTGKLTLVNAATTAGQLDSFLFNNSTLGATDTVEITQLSGAGFYLIKAKNNGNGTMTISVYTPFAVSAEAPQFQFNIIRGSQT